MPDPLVQSRAAALRAALRETNPAYDSLSDADVIRQAKKDPNLDPGNRATLEQEFGDSAGGSFLRGVGRGFGGDLLLKGADAVLGTNSQAWLNDPVLADNTGAGMVGNIAGSIAGLALPGGFIAKAAMKAPKAAALMGALGGVNNVSQGLGEQLEEISTGERSEVHKGNLALQGAIGAAGGATIPGVSKAQALLRGRFPSVAGRGGAVALGAGAGATEGALQGASMGYGDESTLHPGALEQRGSGTQNAILGGIMGGVLGGTFDAFDTSKILPATNPMVKAPGNNPPLPGVPRTATPSATPTLQPPAPLPAQAYTSQEMQKAYQQLRTFGTEGGMEGLRSTGLADITNKVVLGRVAEANRALDSGKTSGFIDPDTNQVMPAVKITGADGRPVWLVEDRRPGVPPGTRKWVSHDVMKKYMGVEQDRLGFEQIIRPLADRPVYNGAKEPVKIGGRNAIPVGLQQTGPEEFQVSVVFPDEGSTAAAQTITVDAANDLPYGAQGRSFLEALLTGAEVDKSNRLARKASRRPDPRAPWHQASDPATPTEGVLSGMDQMEEDLFKVNQRKRERMIPRRPGVQQ
jgi:hypothetical protein